MKRKLLLALSGVRDDDRHMQDIAARLSAWLRKDNNEAAVLVLPRGATVRGVWIDPDLSTIGDLPEVIVRYEDAANGQ
ncbi:MAG: hypothetical protein MUC88_00255 [Planctomycetes bacterium]|jgi:hypothetical protein|nr:hypothetical protein [Planctomycetota bacterium]